MVLLKIYKNVDSALTESKLSKNIFHFSFKLAITDCKRDLMALVSSAGTWYEQVFPVTSKVKRVLEMMISTFSC